jgi:hypothetical protein
MKRYESMVSIHFDGDIVENHQIPMRILGKTISSIQTALDRAYLDIKHEGVWKYARMSQEDYVVTDFLVQAPKEGGYILDFFSKVRKSKQIVDRVSSAIDQAIKETKVKYDAIADQIDRRKLQISKKLVEPIRFKDILKKANNQVFREYGDRSITKEIDQVLSTIRSDYAGESTLALGMNGSSSHVFDFNKSKSKEFHGAVSRRSLSVPVSYSGKLEALDTKNFVGKFVNDETGRTSILHLQSEKDIMKVYPYLPPDKKMKFIGCPLLEFGSLEPYSGDIYFVDLLDTSKSA